MAKKDAEKDLGGRPSVYRPEFCDIANKILSRKGAGREEVAAKLDITMRTFQNWMKVYPEFKVAVEKGLVVAKSELLKDAIGSLQNTKEFSYNTPLFNALLRTVYRDSDQAAVAIDGWSDAKSIREKFDLVTKTMGEGDITPDQASKFADVLTKHLQVTELDAIKKRLDELEGVK